MGRKEEQVKRGRQDSPAELGELVTSHSTLPWASSPGHPHAHFIHGAIEAQEGQLAESPCFIMSSLSDLAGAALQVTALKT